MQTIHILGILVLLAVAVPAAPAHAGGVVTVCDEAHLLAALAGGGTVTFSCSGTITLTTNTAITANTTIDGSGQAVTISGNHAWRVFYVRAGVTLNLNDLTITNGNFNYGGGIHNDGTLIVTNSTFSNNHGHQGGGIFSTNLGTLTVSNSTFSGNSADEYGGGISLINGTLTVSNSTFSGNSAVSGGGIANIWGDTMSVSNSTFSDNTAVVSGGGIYNYSGVTHTVSNGTFSGNSAPAGGGIYNSTNTVTLKNTIVTNSPTGGNCSGTITDGGGNLSYPDTTCPGINADPLLGPLQNNGGPTETMALGEGSAAIDAADDTICAAPPVNNLDQRGFVRPWGAHCDIGAVEQILEPAAVSLSTISAESASGAIPPIIVVGLLLVALASSSAFRRVRQMRCD